VTDIDRGKALARLLGRRALGPSGPADGAPIDLDALIAGALADGELTAADVPEVRTYVAYRREIEAAHRAAYVRHYGCRAAVPGQDRRLTCERDRDHPGDHRHGGATWRTGETPDTEPPPRRRADREDLTELCSELGALRDALEVAAVPGGRGAAGRRSVPGSRPPVDVEALAATEGIETTVRGMWDALRAALGLPTGRGTPQAQLRQIPAYVEALPAGHPLTARVPAVLAARRDHARRVLAWDAEMIWLGDCPSVFEPRDMLTRDGWVAGDTGCWAVDGSAMADLALGQALPEVVSAAAESAADGEEPVIWRRSRMGLPRDADMAHADVVCRVCGYRSRPEDRAQQVLEQLAHQIRDGRL
jgi:hypothetical protein